MVNDPAVQTASSTSSDRAPTPTTPTKPAAAAPTPTVALARWDGVWECDDPFAALKADVAAYSHLDPLVTLEGLSATSGVPVGALARYVLARWAAGGNEAALELGVSGIDHLGQLVADAEEAGTDAARLAAYAGVVEVVRWLRATPGVDDEPRTPPQGPGD